MPRKVTRSTEQTEETKPSVEQEEEEEAAPAPAPAPAPTTTTESTFVSPPSAPEPEATGLSERPSAEPTEPFDKMMREEYERTLQTEIDKGTNKIAERFTRLYAQERNPMDQAVDNLGKTSDYYENLMNALQSGNSKVVGSTIEDVYRVLYDLDFTQMRKLDAIKQQFNQ